jgi:hypothetical protein
MTASNREIEKLFDKYNPDNIRTGDRVLVQLHNQQYFARIVGLDLDIKNKKVYANLKLLDNSGAHTRPTRIDVSDCTRTLDGTSPLYPGHNPQGRK